MANPSFMTEYYISPNIKFSLKIDGFNGTKWTHANGPLYYILTILLGVSFASRLDNGSTHKSSSSLSNASSSLRVVAKLALL